MFTAVFKKPLFVFILIKVKEAGPIFCIRFANFDMFPGSSNFARQSGGFVYCSAWLIEKKSEITLTELINETILHYSTGSKDFV